MPNEINVVSGTSTIPISASTTAIPLNSTARPAVPPARAIASACVRPAPRSSRYRATMNSE